MGCRETAPVPKHTGRVMVHCPLSPREQSTDMAGFPLGRLRSRNLNQADLTAQSQSVEDTKITHSQWETSNRHSVADVDVAAGSHSRSSSGLWSELYHQAIGEGSFSDNAAVQVSSSSKLALRIEADAIASGTSYIAADEKLRGRFEAKLRKPVNSDGDCIIC